MTTTTEQTDFIVFYSWQSDLPNETNRQAIRSALHMAISILESELSEKGLRIVPDEATREMPGSPNIPLTILEKIKSSDAFIADITTINKGASEKRHRTPNPNVLFELGYAAAHLGWGRIIMLFNTEFGEFPGDTPFDIDRQRASPYNLKKPTPPDRGTGSTKQLSNLLVDALRAIINKPTPKPTSEYKLSPEEVRRQRDVANLRWIMAALHIPTLDEFILKTPYLISSRALDFWESFHYVLTNSLFHLYDQTAFKLLRRLHESWWQCVSHDEQYHPTANPNIYVFSNPGDAPLNQKQEEAWNAINNARPKLRASLDKLLALLRNKYIEIDLEETNRTAWNKYVDFHRDD